MLAMGFRTAVAILRPSKPSIREVWKRENETYRRLAEMGELNANVLKSGREPLMVAMKAMVLVNQLRRDGKTEFTDAELRNVLDTAIALTPRHDGG